MISSLLLALALSGGVSGAPLQRALKGTVQDNSGAPVAGATVIVACPNEARSTYSDGRGQFQVEGLPSTRCTVSGSAEHFAPTLIEVDLSTGPVLNARLVLPVQTLDESVVVTTSAGFRESATESPLGVAIVGRRELALRPYTVLPQVLREEAGVLVQQTTSSAGSPVIRGFTGQSNIYLVDGVRLNTSIWRSGPVQYLAWLTPVNVERLELVRGPVSVQYGSDALGGAVNVIGARPAFADGGVKLTGQLEGTIASADRSGGVQGTVALHHRRFAAAIAATTRSAGELRAGGGRDSHAAVTRFLGLPSRTLYERLPSTGFAQRGVHVTAQARVGLTGILSSVYRHDRQNGISRYDRIAGGEGLFRSEITPQRFHLGFLRYEQPAMGVLGGVRLTFSVNRQEDGTIEQARPLAASAVNGDRTSVTALGYQAQGQRRLRFASLTYGADLYDERIDGERWQQVGPTLSAIRPLIPDGTRYRSAGAFAQVTRDLFERLSVRGGVRYGRYVYRTTSAPAFAIAPETVVSQAMTFNTAASVRFSESLRATFSVSRGFRAANASDLGAVGVSGGGGFEISPATARELGALVGTTDGGNAVSTGRRVGDLLPESEMAYEAGIRASTGRLAASLTVFDLELRDAIQRRAAIFTTDVVGHVISGREIVRQDAEGRAFIAIDPRPITTRVNSSRARVRGLDAEGTLRVGRAWTARAWFSLSNGRDLESGGYLRRMNPPMGGSTLAWAGPRRLTLETVLTFARAQTRLTSGDFGDARIGGQRSASTIAAYFNGTATDLGLVRDGILLPTGETLAQVQARVLGGASVSRLFDQAPGFVALGLRGMYPLSRRADLVVIGENLTDRNYRLLGSGVDAPGRNLQARVRVRF
ncbi:MAG TPA: TonB-dependent receptor [Vicinamibacterales bacterium]|nr:TonB-dependent receptor [Vicinamibacterales bacterium]